MAIEACVGWIAIEIQNEMADLTMELVQFATLRAWKSRNNSQEKLKSSDKGRYIPTRAAKQPVLRMGRPVVDVARGTTSKSCV